jgi:hypothetical protein
VIRCKPQRNPQTSALGYNRKWCSELHLTMFKVSVKWKWLPAGLMRRVDWQKFTDDSEEQQPRRQSSSYPPPWEPQISHLYNSWIMMIQLLATPNETERDIASQMQAWLEMKAFPETETPQAHKVSRFKPVSLFSCTDNQRERSTWRGLIPCKTSKKTLAKRLRTR